MFDFWRERIFAGPFVAFCIGHIAFGRISTEFKGSCDVKRTRIT